MRLGWMLAVIAFGASGAFGALGACWTREQPAPPLTGRAMSTAPAAPEPTVRWAQREITMTGLPAIASDGSTIVVAYRDSDGGRGNPNLTLIEKDRGDREVSRLVVLTPTEADTLAPAQIEDRFEKAAAWLREHHTTAHLVPMTAFVTRKPTEGAPDTAAGAGVILRWAANQLTLEGAPGTSGPPGTPIRRTTPTSWLAPDYPLCRSCTEVCHNDAFLGGGYIDLARKAVVVVVAYRGTDTCWEPGSQAHVVTW